jgi:Cysteine-rich CPCC
MYTCPCCGYRTLSDSTGSYEICEICGWEDDPVQLRWPGYRGGANHESLCEAQRAFLGARSVPPERPDAARDPAWRPLHPGECVDAIDAPPRDTGVYYWLDAPPT